MLPSPDSPAHVLVVDDEPQIRRALTSLLGVRDYEVTSVESGEEALSHLKSRTPDLIVLDLSLPGMSGLEVCRAVRTRSRIPILVLSVRDEERDKVAALDLGADDYLTKPFSAAELLARVRALLRRSSDASSQGVVAIDDLEVDLFRRLVRVSGEEVHLTPIEFDILAMLVESRGAVVSSGAILTRVWGAEWSDDASLLRVHVSNLRKKIEPDPAVPRLIVTEPGVGFRFRAD